MAAFNFPNSPSTNDLHTENSVTWKWNGTVWKRVNNSYLTASTLNVSGIGTFGGNVSIADKIIHTGDTDTSIRFPSNDNISMEIAGTERFDLTSTTLSIHGNIRASDYVAHRTVDSLGVKFYNAGAGNNNTHVGLGAEDNGTSGGINHKTFQVFRQGSSVNRVNIDASGNLNIVTGKLQINDTIEHIGDSNTKIRFPAADTFSVETAGLQNFKVNGTRVALTSPSGTNTTLRLQHQGNSGYGDIILDRTVNAFIIDNDPSNASNNQSYFSVKNKGTENLRILHDGRICMGSTNVGSGSADDLNIENTSDHGGITIRTPNNKWGSIHFADGGTGNELYRGQISYDHDNDRMRFYIGAGQRLQIDSSGRLGISHDLSGTANYNRLMIHNPLDGSCWIQLTSTASGNSANTDGLSLGLNTSNMGHIWLRENAPLAFATNATERMRFTSGDCASFGNSSPPAWQTGGGYYNLQLGNAGYFRADTDASSNFLSFGLNAYRDSSGWKFVENGKATQVSHQNGEIFFNVSNSGNADNAITFSEAFRIDSSGRVTKPSTPSFWVNATPTIGTQSGNTYVAYSFSNIKHNIGSHYNNSNGRFTAPVAGTYMFGGGLWCNSSDNNSGSHLLVFDKNGGEAGIGCNHRHSGNQLMATMCIELAANDYIQLGFASGSGGSIQGSTPRNYFWGYLVG